MASVRVDAVRMSAEENLDGFAPGESRPFGTRAAFGRALELPLAYRVSWA